MSRNARSAPKSAPTAAVNTPHKLIQLPANPCDLVDMYELRDRIKLLNYLSGNVNDYVYGYHDSMAKTAAEWSALINPEHAPDFKVFTYDKSYGKVVPKVEKLLDFPDNKRVLLLCDFRTKTLFETKSMADVEYGQQPDRSYTMRDCFLLTCTTTTWHNSFPSGTLQSVFSHVAVFDMDANRLVHATVVNRLYRNYPHSDKLVDSSTYTDKGLKDFICGWYYSHVTGNTPPCSSKKGMDAFYDAVRSDSLHLPMHANGECTECDAHRNLEDYEDYED